MNTHLQDRWKKKQTHKDLTQEKENLDSMDNPIHVYETNLAYTAVACVDKSMKTVPFHELNPVESWLYSLHVGDEAECPTMLESKPIPTHRKSQDTPTHNIAQIQQNIQTIQKRAHAVSTIFASLCRYQLLPSGPNTYYKHLQYLQRNWWTLYP